MGVSSKMRWSWVSRHSLCVTLRTFQILITPSSPPVARYLRSTLNFIHQIAFLGVSYTVHDGRVFSQLLTDVKIGELLVALFHHRHLDRAFHVVVLLRITKRIERNGGLRILIFSICDYTNATPTRRWSLKTPPTLSIRHSSRSNRIPLRSTAFHSAIQRYHFLHPDNETRNQLTSANKQRSYCNITLLGCVHGGNVLDLGLPGLLLLERPLLALLQVLFGHAVAELDFLHLRIGELQHEGHEAFLVVL